MVDLLIMLAYACAIALAAGILNRRLPKLDRMALILWSAVPVPCLLLFVGLGCSAFLMTQGEPPGAADSNAVAGIGIGMLTIFVTTLMFSVGLAAAAVATKFLKK